MPSHISSVQPLIILLCWLPSTTIPSSQSLTLSLVYEHCLDMPFQRCPVTHSFSSSFLVQASTSLTVFLTDAMISPKTVLDFPYSFYKIILFFPPWVFRNTWSAMCDEMMLKNPDSSLSLCDPQVFYSVLLSLDVFSNRTPLPYCIQLHLLSLQTST